MTEAIRFTGPIVAARDVRADGSRGGGALVEVPRELIAALGGVKQMRVLGTLNGLPFRSSTMPMGGGRLCIGVHKATREQVGADIGDLITLEVSRDDAARVLELASELDAAFDAEPELRERFDALAFTRRRELADPILEAKRSETRAARLDRTVRALRELPGSVGTST
jgi:hypothetical protein